MTTTIKLQNKDTHTLCPVPGTVQGATFPMTVGTRIKTQEGQILTVKGSTAYMAWFNEKVNFVGCSKATPQSMEFELQD